ncbi:hypothetical protein BKA57DRAFT_223411 [Linnemannia elongata]|nr:hypothetical protein BKA57DRAFT_223411 [Linnemannia elongata]
MAASSIKAPMRTRSSSAVSSTSPTLVSVKSFSQRVVAAGGASKTLPSIATTLSAANSIIQNQSPIQAQSTQSHTQGQGQAQQGQSSTTTSNKPKRRRPSLPILPASQTQQPSSQKPSSPFASQLQPTKDIQSLRTPRSLPRLNAVAAAAAADRNDSNLAPSHIGRPASALSSPRSYTSASSSPRLGSSASASRFGDSRPTSALSHTNNSSSTSSSTPSLIAKPVSRTQKSTTIKPPSIVTKPNSPGSSNNGSNPSTSMSNASNTSNSTGVSSSSSGSGSSSARGFSLPPIAPSPNTASVQTPLSTTSSTASSSSLSGSSPLIGSSSIPTLTSLTAAVSAAAAASPSGLSSTSTTGRSKNRLNAGIDSACYMTRSSSGESLASSSTLSSPVSTPVTASTPTMASTAAATGIGTATLLPSSAATNPSRKPISRRPSTADLTPASSPLACTDSFVSPSKSTTTKPAGTRAASPLSHTDITNKELITQPTSQQQTITAAAAVTTSTTTTTTVVKCTCPPPLEFPENVKREMRREEEEHRQRECGLYEKIIELQIENANLQGEKDSLHRVLSRRDKMLLELQMQLQAMEFVCRENEIKVDIDMCPDEAIENWSFKESDEVYQRILLTTQDLLRTGSKCLEENMVMPRSSSQHQRPTRTASFPSSASSTTRSSLGSNVPINFALFDNGVAPRRNVVAGLSEGAQPLTVQDQEVDPLLFKETSRPGTLKLDLHTLLRSEQEFNSNKTRSTINQGNLAEVDAGIERGGRRAIDCGDDRSSFFRAAIGSSNNNHVDSAVDDESDDDEDDTEGEESEFEELGEDMIKFVDLQSSVVPRRDSRASSFSMLMPPGGTHSAATTPDLSSAVLMKNMWSANGSARRSASTTPLHHPAFQQMPQQQQHHYHQHHQHYSQPHRNSANRSSGGSTLSSSSGSLLEDYFTRPQEQHQVQQSASVGLGLGLTGLGRSPEQLSTERLFSAPPRDAPPPPPPSRPLPPFPMSHSRSGSPRAHPLSNSPLGHDSSSTFPSAPSSHYQLNHHLNNSNNNNNAIRPPPSTPLPPLPSQTRYSYRAHTKTQLLQAKVPTHGRTCSHGFAIENVGQFLKRRTYGKTLTRDTMHRGLRRRDSV